MGGGMKACFGPAAIESVGERTLPTIIKEIKALPPGAILTGEQITALEKNIDALLSVLGNGKNSITSQITTFATDPRFRFLEQVPGALEKLEKAFEKYLPTVVRK